MNEKNELLVFVYKNAEMGAFSTEKLIERLKNKENKIKALLEEEHKEYNNFVKKCKKILKSNNIEPQENSMFTKMQSGMGIAMETMMDNSDAALAQMLVEGFTMGVVQTTTKISAYKSIVDKSTLSIAKKYLKFQEDEIEKLKEFM